MVLLNNDITSHMQTSWLACHDQYFAVVWQACSIRQMRAADLECYQPVQLSIFRSWMDFFFFPWLIESTISCEELSRITLYLGLWYELSWLCYRTKTWFLWMQTEVVHDLKVYIKHWAKETKKIWITIWQIFWSFQRAALGETPTMAALWDFSILSSLIS